MGSLHRGTLKIASRDDREMFHRQAGKRCGRCDAGGEQKISDNSKMKIELYPKSDRRPKRWDRKSVTRRQVTTQFGYLKRPDLEFPEEV
jgi:hypothetical protein